MTLTQLLPYLTLLIKSRGEMEELLSSSEGSSFTHLFCALDANRGTWANAHIDVPDIWKSHPAEKSYWAFDDVRKITPDYTAVTGEQIQDMIDKFRAVGQFIKEKPAKVLINCFAGISRSTAMGYVLLCTLLEPGQEQLALNHVQTIRTEAVPNTRVVDGADRLLKRQGSLSKPVEKLMAESQGGMYGWH